MANDYSADSANPNPRGVARIFYKEVVDGDVRKVNGDSNDTKSGGGAVDFRFGGYNKVEPIMQRFFPDSETVKSNRKKQEVDLEIRRGRFYWADKDEEKNQEVECWPPTPSRQSEGRIACVHKVPCFEEKNIPPLSAGNLVLLLLVQCRDGTVWPYFIEESSLTLPDAWDSRIPNTILPCIKAKRASKRTVIGYRDFETGESYCNGK